MGTSSPSVSAQIADVQRLIEKSGVKYTMHSAGTTLGTFLWRLMSMGSPGNTVVNESYRRTVGQSLSGYRTGSYPAPSAGDIEDPDGY